MGRLRLYYSTYRAEPPAAGTNKGRGRHVRVLVRSTYYVVLRITFFIFFLYLVAYVDIVELRQ
jgi:hypothetical protein